MTAYLGCVGGPGPRRERSRVRSRRRIASEPGAAVPGWARCGGSSPARRSRPSTSSTAMTIRSRSTIRWGAARVSALDPSLLGLPVLPFAVMAEMTAQTAALVVSPGLVLTGLEEVRAHKWVRYEEAAGLPRAAAGIVSSRTTMNASGSESSIAAPTARPRPRGRCSRRSRSSARLRPPRRPPRRGHWRMPRPASSRPESVYGEQWLFHGPAFQAIVHMGQLSSEGIEGVLRVLPLEPLLKPGQPPRFHTDLVVIDNFTQLLGCWGLDYLGEEGDVMFPLGMEDWKSTAIVRRSAPKWPARSPSTSSSGTAFAWRPSSSGPMARSGCGSATGKTGDSTGRAGTATLPATSADYLVGEELPLEDPGSGPIRRAKAVWLEPPADMGRPVWRDVLEHTQLGPDERAAHLALGGPEQRRSHRLWGRIAAKEAARRLWKDDGRPPRYPADLAIVADERGRPRLTRVDQPDDPAMPAISIAHAEGVAVALAARTRRPGSASTSRPIVDRPEDFEAAAFTPGERALLDRCPPQARAEWIARFWCAKEAAAKASGLGLADDPSGAEVVEVDERSGTLLVRIVSSVWAIGFCKTKSDGIGP